MWHDVTALGSGGLGFDFEEASVSTSPKIQFQYNPFGMRSLGYTHKNPKLAPKLKRTKQTVDLNDYSVLKF